MLPLTGLTVICGNVLERKPATSERLPFVAVLWSVVTVTGAPKLTPRSVDFLVRIWAGTTLESYQNAWTAWSVPTTT